MEKSKRLMSDASTLLGMTLSNPSPSCCRYERKKIGFTSRTISLFLSEKLEVVYSRKRHQKDKIKALGAEKNEYYRKFLV